VQSIAPELFESGVQTIEAVLCEDAGCKPMEAVSDAPFEEAVTTAVWVLVTAPALAVKLAMMVPAATLTDPGTVNAASLLDSVTVKPPEPAGLDSVTVHVEVPPELTVAGVQKSELKDASGERIMLAVCELPL
jgi:hypothetical protein